MDNLLEVFESAFKRGDEITGNRGFSLSLFCIVCFESRMLYNPDGGLDGKVVFKLQLGDGDYLKASLLNTS